MNVTSLLKIIRLKKYFDFGEKNISDHLNTGNAIFWSPSCFLTIQIMDNSGLFYEWLPQNTAEIAKKYVNQCPKRVVWPVFG